MRINEIFYSLQGEGQHTGTPAVFLRFSGCNLNCSFCDTRHDSYTEMTLEDVLNAVKQYSARTIVLTGGEPLLQITPSLTDALHNEGFTIHMETNGTRALPEGVKVDWITCSPKHGGAVRLEHIDELKVVYTQQDMSLYDGLKAQTYSLQPLDSGDDKRNSEIVKQTINYILNNHKWKLSLQTHKILNLQ